MASFSRCNLDTLPLERVRAHGGDGDIGFCRIADATALAGGPGDLIRNPPGGEHALRAVGPEPVRLFVFAVRVPPAAASGAGAR